MFVVFEGRGGAGNYQGIRTWTAIEDEELCALLESWRAQGVEDVVVAKCATEAEAKVRARSSARARANLVLSQMAESPQLAGFYYKNQLVAAQKDGVAEEYVRLVESQGYNTWELGFWAIWGGNQAPPFFCSKDPLFPCFLID